ncbi:MAG: hypothetical protein CMJ81_01175 [Planctomycetaceae bacterium]|jgi:hypothetical protein|nr:hypothetical protein [Planctomycetaceae bacterium]
MLKALILIGLATIPVTMGAWILRPLDRAAKNRKHPTRFTMLDFFGLVFLAQIPLAVIHSLVFDGNGWLVWFFDVLAWIGSLVIWWFGVKTFSNAGIRSTWIRAGLVFLALPMAFYGSFAVVVIASLLWTPANLETEWVIIFVVLEVGLLTGIASSAHYTRFAISATTESPPQE